MVISLLLFPQLLVRRLVNTLRQKKYVLGAETGKATKLGMYNHDPVKVFEHLDVSKDGSLSKEEFTTALKRIGLPFKPNHVGELLSAFDVDQDGHISKDEFVKMATELLNANKEKTRTKNKNKKQGRHLTKNRTIATKKVEAQVLNKRARFVLSFEA